MAKILEARLSQMQVKQLMLKGAPEAKEMLGIIAREAEALGVVRTAILFPRTATDFEINTVMMLLESAGRSISTDGKLAAYEINRQ